VHSIVGSIGLATISAIGAGAAAAAAAADADAAIAVSWNLDGGTGVTVVFTARAPVGVPAEGARKRLGFGN
jgi:hypothetical protein